MADHSKTDAPFDDAEDTTEATDEALVPEDAPADFSVPREPLHLRGVFCQK